MAAFRRVYDSHHLHADCQEPGSAPEPHAQQSSMGYLYLFRTFLMLKLRSTNTAVVGFAKHLTGDARYDSLEKS